MKEITLLLFLLFCAKINAQHISGNVFLNFKQGLINAEFELTEIPSNFTEPAILLNSGMNIRLIQNKSREIIYNFDESRNELCPFEARLYSVTDSDGNLFLPEHLSISYTGAFPVFSSGDDMSDWVDWKGNIAFCHQTLRMSEQSVWYPQIIDLKTGQIISKYTYDLNIRTEEDQSIYINGSDIETGSQFHLSSAKPQFLFLFGGQFEYNDQMSNTFINTGLSKSQIDYLNSTTDRIKAYYSSIFNITYDVNPCFISCVPPARKIGYAFVSYPSICFLGHDRWSLKGYFTAEDSTLVDPMSLNFISHELAHYYFGNYSIPYGPLKWTVLEGVSEFLSYKYLQAHHPETASILLEKYKNAEHNYPSLESLSEDADLSNDYKYKFVPLMLIKIEVEIGEKALQKWLETLLIEAGRSEVNYKMFLDCFRKAGLQEDEIDLLESNYFQKPMNADLIK